MEPKYQQPTQQRLLELDPAALLQDGAQEQWEAISDLDSFFARVYAYYHERGLQCILASRIISLLTLAFTILLFIFLVELLDWHAVVYDCHNEDSCLTISLIRRDWLHTLSAFRVVYYYLLFTLYFLYSLGHFLMELRPLFEMHTLFRDKLQIADTDLHVIAWDEIVVKLIELQRTARFMIIKDQLTAHDIANRIMRKDNFLIALTNRQLLPLPPCSILPSMMSQTLEWNLYVAILDTMFDSQFRIRQSFTRDVGALQRRFLACGFITLALAPFFAMAPLIRPRRLAILAAMLSPSVAWQSLGIATAPHTCICIL